MPFFDDHGRRLHYLVRGSGPPTVLIHGLGSSAADWAFQVPALESLFRLIVPDLPGCGLSVAPQAGFTVPRAAESLWALLDALDVAQPNLVGFSLGGAVAMEMALARPAAVPRLALINTLATYRIDHWTKWCKARVDAALVRALGMQRTAKLIAARLFPDPWQQPMRERAENVIGAVPASTYLGMAAALLRWTAAGRLHELQCSSLVIAAEHDYTPLAEKRAMAARIAADCIVVRGSRHGTPFDSITVTNACLAAFLTGRELPESEQWQRDQPSASPPAAPENSIVDEHAAAVWAFGRSGEAGAIDADGLQYEGGGGTPP